MFAAQLSLPASTTPAARLARVRAVLHRLRLTEADAGTRIGSVERRGLSGGQRKRKIFIICRYIRICIYASIYVSIYVCIYVTIYLYLSLSLNVYVGIYLCNISLSLYIYIYIYSISLYRVKG